MGNDSSQRPDLTRIEDLTEFLHDEEEHDQPEESPLNSKENDENEQELEGSEEEQELESPPSFEENQEEQEFESPPSFEENQEEQEFESPPSFEENQEEQELESPPSFEENQEEQEFESPPSFEENQEEQEFESPPSFEENQEEQEFESPPSFEENQEEQEFESPPSFEENQEEQEFEPLPTPEENEEEQEFKSPSRFGNNKENPEEKSIPKESFNDVTNFAQNLNNSTNKSGGPPSYSLLLKGILSNKHHEDILNILNEYNIIQDQNLTQTSLNLGHLLIPQISEFAAIFLASKLKKYTRNIKLGLSEEIHQSSSYTHDNKGYVSPHSLLQNKDFKYQKTEVISNSNNILTSTNSSISNKLITKYLGVISESQTCNVEDLSKSPNKNKVDRFNTTTSLPLEIFDHLLSLLKLKAYKKNANCILSLNYSFHPMESTNEIYQIICTGNAVIIEGE